jgi:hypothetical protein
MQLEFQILIHRFTRGLWRSRGIARASTEVDRQSELTIIVKLRLRDNQLVLMRGITIPALLSVKPGLSFKN